MGPDGVVVICSKELEKQTSNYFLLEAASLYNCSCNFVAEDLIIFKEQIYIKILEEVTFFSSECIEMTKDLTYTINYLEVCKGHLPYYL